MPRHAPIEEFEDINRGLAYVRSLRTTWPGSISASGMGNVYRLLGLPLERHLEEWPDDLELLTRPRYIASIARDHGHFYYSPRLWWMVDRRTPCRWTLENLTLPIVLSIYDHPCSPIGRKADPLLVNFRD